MKIEEYENSQKSVYEITKINYVINNLNDEDYERIPKKVVNFFNKGITDEFKDNNLNALSSMNNNELKLLKIIDYYINDKDV